MIFEITITMVIYLIFGFAWTGTKHALAWEITKHFSWPERLRHWLFEIAVWPYDVIDVFLSRSKD